MIPLTTVELFAGAGGMALGAEVAGFHHAALVEFDPLACATLRHNRPAWNVIEADVRDVDFKRYAGLDLLTAGAPCQPFSTAGKRLLNDDPRNLFPQVVRAVRAIQPRALLLENVKGMLVGDARAYFDHIVRRLAALGYDVAWHLINCADYGVSQRRERVFVVGLRRDLGCRWAWPVATHGLDALLYAQWVEGTYWNEHRLTPPDVAPFAQIQRLDRLWPSPYPPPRQRWRTLRDALPSLGATAPAAPSVGPYYGDRKVNTWDEPAKTLTTRWDKTLVTDGNGSLRYLTIPELARLQVFPDAWRFVGTNDDQLRQVGNAVPSAAAAVLVAQIATCLQRPATAA